MTARLRPAFFLAVMVVMYPCSNLTVVAGQPSGTQRKAAQFVPSNPAPLIQAPDDPRQWPAWREQLGLWRATTRRRLEYNDSLYRRSDFAWVPSCYSCCFFMMCDETFYNRAEGIYTVEEFLQQGAREFGGYDAVVLWHAYPRIGFDNRNQFDFYCDMPGGLAGLRDVCRRFHAHNVKVFIDYNPWDTGTRRENQSDIDALTGILKAIDADGVFLDTLVEGAAEFRTKLDGVRRGLILEPELVLPVERIHDHHMSWAQWFRDSTAPGVLRSKWFERRHMMHEIKRSNRDHTGELHTAWMNGSGMLVWENVFGSWNGWNPRDRSILRSMLPIQRRYVGLFSGETWMPLVATDKRHVYASSWGDENLRLWTLINRSEELIEGPLLKVPHAAGARYFDLLAGRELKHAGGETASLSGTMRPRGIGAFLAARQDALDEDFSTFLTNQREIDARADFATTFPDRDANLLLVTRTRKCRRENVPEGMVFIPATAFDMTVQFRNRECGFYSTPEHPDLKRVLPKLHTMHTFARKVTLTPYAIDITPVTNAQFARFLAATRYQPRHPENFLKHWKNDAPPPGMENHPVVYVDLDDARAYARWAGKRLPTEAEWQFAAQGSDGRRYPWGHDMKAKVCNDGQTGGTTDVTAFPAGRSPFGCYDMCGNVWEWTESERSDGRTRFCIIRGGSFYKAAGSKWYTDGGPQPCDFGAKFLLMWPGLDRCATVGFRCVVDCTE